jgi:hypothetical protein
MGGPPHRFRVTVHSLPNSRTPAKTVEVGGALGKASGLSYLAASNALLPDTIGFPIQNPDINPASFIQTALKSGEARDEGTTTIQGHPARRIALNAARRPIATATYYVDAHTYEPLRITNHVAQPNGSRLAVPLASILQLPYFGNMPGTNAPYIYTYDFTTFQYLPPTQKNLALTDIKTQYPAAQTN